MQSRRSIRGAQAAIAWLATLLATHSLAFAAAIPERSISASRQFIVYGSDQTLRSAVCDLAERTKNSALSVLGQTDRWTTPIVVHAQHANTATAGLPPAQLHVSQTGFGLKLQLELRFGAQVSALAIERELLRALLLEMMYRGEPNTPAGTVYVEPPDWLLEGILHAHPKADTTALVDALKTAMASEETTSLEMFLRQKPALLESPSRKVYQAYAAALVSILTSGSESPAKFRRYLAALPQATNDPLADLQRHFPALGGAEDKVWKNGVARFAAREDFRLLGAEETERRLAGLLRVAIAKGNRPAAIYSLEEFPQFIREPAAKPALQRLMLELAVLGAQVNPLYRVVIDEYQQIISLLQRQKRKRVAQRLAEVRATREQLSRRLSAIGDYLNWCEATQARTVSGAFREYLQAAETAQNQERRRDPISVYLDALEAQF